MSQYPFDEFPQAETPTTITVNGITLSKATPLALSFPTHILYQGQARYLSNTPASATTVINGATAETSQIGVEMINDAVGIRLRYSNTYTADSYSGGPLALIKAAGNAITVKASIQIPSGTSLLPNGWTADTSGSNESFVIPTDARTQVIQATWGNRNSIILQPGEHCVSDYIALPRTILKGRRIYVRSFVSISSGIYPLHGIKLFGPYSTAKHNRPSGATAGADLTGVATDISEVGASSNISCFGPIAVEITPLNKVWSKPARVMTIGDSRLTSLPFSWLGQALYNLNYPHYEYSLAGDTRFSYPTSPNSLRDETMAMATHLIDCYGQNDFSRTLSGMQADVMLMAAKARAVGTKYIVATVYPQTNAGNTVSGDNSVRTPFNQWLRTQVSAGTIDGVLDSSDALAAATPGTAVRTRDGGFFVQPDGVTSYNGYTPVAGNIAGDGIHCSATGNSILTAYATEFLPALLG